MLLGQQYQTGILEGAIEYQYLEGSMSITDKDPSGGRRYLTTYLSRQPSLE